MSPPGKGPARRLAAVILAMGMGVVLGMPLAGCQAAVSMPGSSHQGEGHGDPALAERLRQHVTLLAGRIGDRNVTALPKALDQAARYVAWQWEEMGLTVTSQTFTSRNHAVRNVETLLPGDGGEMLIVGAHYDTPHGTPGADDNASGVAMLLELARLLREAPPRSRTIRLVAFVNEELPFFDTPEMGSRVHAQRARAEGWPVVGMVALESVGFYDTRPGSQKYPPPLGLFYPVAGDFLAFVADPDSRPLLFDLVAAFRRHALLPSEGLAAPAWLPGLAWSDHISYRQAGFPAVMVTDTAFYRNPHYHTDKDTPETLDYPRLALATTGLAAALGELADTATQKGLQLQ